MNRKGPSRYMRLSRVAAAFIFAVATVIVAIMLSDSRSRAIFMAFAALSGALMLLLTSSESSLKSQAMRARAAELERQTEEAQALAAELEEFSEETESKAAAQLAEAQSLAKLGSWEWDVSSNSIEWSDEMYRLYGLEPGSGSLDYEKYQSLVHPDDRDHSRSIVAESLDSGEPFSFHHRIIRPDGEERVFHARGKVVIGPDGTAIRMLGTGQDVTEMKRAEAALNDAAQLAVRQQTAEAATHHLNRILAQAPVVIAVLSGPNHVFEIANAKAVEMLGGRELIGKPLREAIPIVSGGQYEALIESVYKSGKAFIGREMYAKIESDHDDEEGGGGYFNFVFQPLSNENGVYAVLIVATEVTDLVNARMAAEKSQGEALAANRAKSDFLARMSHELRTPLAAIMGYGELLADGITGPVNDEQQRQLMRIKASANHLLSIIDEILTLARMEAGKERVSVQDVHLNDLLESVASMAEPLAAAKGLSFELVAAPPSLVMKTDPIKLRQVLLNLISNAVKYTDSGSVSLESCASDGHVNFFVKDTGLGVSEEHLEKIFEPFWQVEQTTTRRSGGTGLGLAVTRQFVDLLGGRITVNSELGKGSAFQVSLPVQPGEKFGVSDTLDS